MDYNFFSGNNFQWMSVAPGTEQGDISRNNSIVTNPQPEVFDPSAIFQTPYDTFRFQPLVTQASPPDFSELTVAISRDDSTPLPSAGLVTPNDPSMPMDYNQGDRRSSSEEKDLTPAQSRRKAQNRNAQRAFRERKEKHVKELETKLNSLETSATSLASDNQRLKLALQRAMTENEILRATRGSRSSLASLNAMRGFSAPESAESNVDDDSDASSPDISGEVENKKRGSVESKGTARKGKRRALKDFDEFSVGLGQNQGAMLSSNALWDFLIEHPLVSSGQVDIADACDRLRGLAKPGSHGPVFAEDAVRRAIESSRRGGGGALI